MIRVTYLDGTTEEYPDATTCRLTRAGTIYAIDGPEGRVEIPAKNVRSIGPVAPVATPKGGQIDRG